jgi:hypothetical protein
MEINANDLAPELISHSMKLQALLNHALKVL